MSNVFISHVRSTQAQAKQIAEPFSRFVDRRRLFDGWALPEAPRPWEQR
jgi:hypothetical protein